MDSEINTGNPRLQYNNARAMVSLSSASGCELWVANSAWNLEADKIIKLPTPTGKSIFTNLNGGGPPYHCVTTKLFVDTLAVTVGAT